MNCTVVSLQFHHTKRIAEKTVAFNPGNLMWETVYDLPLVYIDHVTLALW